MDWHKKVYAKKPTEKPGDDWKRLRLAVWKRDKGKCKRCDKKTRLEKDGATAHHLIPRTEGGVDDLSNLVWLCPECHDLVEVQGLRTVAEIVGSLDDSMLEAIPILPEPKKGEESFERPDWHAWVYGGQRNPQK